MGDHNEKSARGVSSRFKLTVSIAFFLIGLEGVHASEVAPGSWVSDSTQATTSVLLPSSLNDRHRALPTASGEGSEGIVLGERAPVAGGELSRRELLTSYSLLFIGYGVLTAGYVPCPPRSGRSYYTNNCQSASGPVRPYRRGCSRISRCARG